MPLPTDASAPAIARHTVQIVLNGHGLRGQAVGDVLLATSELVTNAFEHGGEPERLELEYAGGRLLLRVFDSGKGVPKLKTPAPFAARSRGLQLVDMLATAWGVEQHEGGKYVWAEFLMFADNQG